MNELEGVIDVRSDVESVDVESSGDFPEEDNDWDSDDNDSDFVENLGGDFAPFLWEFANEPSHDHEGETENPYWEAQYYLSINDAQNESAPKKWNNLISMYILVYKGKNFLVRI